MLLYTYISRFSVNPHYQQQLYLRPPLVAFSTSRTNGPRSLLQAKAGTHSALLKGSHTSAYTPKHGYFRWGWYHYPRSVSHGSETLRGRVSERQTLPPANRNRRRSLPALRCKMSGCWSRRLRNWRRRNDMKSGWSRRKALCCTMNDIMEFIDE